MDSLFNSSTFGSKFTLSEITSSLGCSLNLVWLVRKIYKTLIIAMIKTKRKMTSLQLDGFGGIAEWHL